VNEFENLVLIGGSPSIMLLYQLLNHALNNPVNWTRFTLLYGNVTEADSLLRNSEELAVLECVHPNMFCVVHTLDKHPVG
jgi:NAD(P)H-flavin reductase